jgi:uroporphyrin-III C-methyltransferase/precorrin-2 dehydrogenase/sirohydrochlorin ferrochelatase
MSTARKTGTVYLVGAGPGDPELLTLRAARLLEEAEVVVYDNLVSPEVMARVAPGARRIYAGKQRANHTMPQQDINALLVELAGEYRVVVRLKGGDPFIFGRGGEEMEALATHGIAFEVVPGITAACGISCYAGIPLTHRDHAQSVMFVTGHLKDGSSDLAWQTLARTRQTVVIYMGLGAIDEICRQLIAHGMSPDTPIAVVERGTTVRQRALTATLATMPSRAAAVTISAPTLTIVGDVVRLHDRLAWFHPEGVE